MKQKDEKKIYNPDKGVKIVPLSLIIFLLCGLSFYLGGVFCPEKNKIAAKDITDVVTKSSETVKPSAASPLQIKSVSFPECDMEYQDYTPCTDPRV